MPITSMASSREALILLRELNHRHFNGLQLIAIALARCAGQPTPAQTQTKLAELVNRLHVHASLHRLLSQAPDPELLESHCLALCSNLVRMFGREDITPYVRMDRVDLSAVQAFWISLLVAELVTNVLKHSLADDQGGTIWIDMLNVRSDEVELRVSDSRKAPLKSQPRRDPSIVGAVVEILSGTIDVLCDDAYVTRICVPVEAKRRDIERTRASMVAWARFVEEEEQRCRLFLSPVVGGSAFRTGGSRSDPPRQKTGRHDIAPRSKPLTYSRRRP